MSKNTNFSIDVIIPVYNGEAFIKDAIDSVLAQSYPPKRLIIVNDGSTDGTEKIILSYHRPRVPINYLKKTNSGLSSARNAGIKIASSPFIALLDADDIWEVNKLERQISLFRRFPSSRLGVVYCDYRNIGEDGRELVNFPSSKLNLNWRGDLSQKLVSGNRVTGSGSAVLVKREIFMTVGFFDEKLPSCEDWDMWLRIAKYYDFDYVPERLLRLRRHSTNLQKDSRAMLVGTLMLTSKLIDSGTLDPKSLKSFRYQILQRIVDEFPKKQVRADVMKYLSSETREKMFADKFYLIKSLVHILFAKARDTVKSTIEYGCLARKK